MDSKMNWKEKLFKTFGGPREFEENILPIEEVPETKGCFGSFQAKLLSCVECEKQEKCALETLRYREILKKIEESREPMTKPACLQRPSKDTYYLDIAIAVSKRSTCLKRHYGCVIVKDNVIIATGYNGSPRGEENCCDRGSCKRASCERYTGYENCDSVHAEQNALIATSRDRLLGATVYLACEEYGYDQVKSDLWDVEIVGFHEDKNPIPCGMCMRMLKNAGVIRIVNREGEVYVRN